MTNSLPVRLPVIRGPLYPETGIFWKSRHTKTLTLCGPRSFWTRGVTADDVLKIGVASCGDTLEGAIENLKEAVALYLENAKVLGLMEDIQPSLTATEKYTTRPEFSL